MAATAILGASSSPASPSPGSVRRVAYGEATFPRLDIGWLREPPTLAVAAVSVVGATFRWPTVISVPRPRTLDEQMTDNEVERVWQPTEIVWRYSTGERVFRGLEIASPQESRDLSFCGTDLSHADFSECWIHDGDFTGATLNGASFTFAHVKSCCFDKADLRNADFSGAGIDAATFEGADLTGATFDGASAFGHTFTKSDRPGS